MNGRMDQGGGGWMDRAGACARDVFEINPSSEEPRDESTCASTCGRRGKIPAAFGTRSRLSLPLALLLSSPTLALFLFRSFPPLSLPPFSRILLFPSEFQHGSAVISFGRRCFASTPYTAPRAHAYVKARAYMHLCMRIPAHLTATQRRSRRARASRRGDNSVG